MKPFHYIEMRVFEKELDDHEQLMKAIHLLFPFDFKKEKINHQQDIAHSFEDKKIIIHTITLKKSVQMKKVMDNLLTHLDDEQKQMLIRQMKTRLDDALKFYFRLDKEELINGAFWITDEGNCFRFCCSIRAYPHKREVAEEIIKSVFSI